jgi:hypothetical protein
VLPMWWHIAIGGGGEELSTGSHSGVLACRWLKRTACPHEQGRDPWLDGLIFLVVGSLDALVFDIIPPSIGAAKVRNAPASWAPLTGIYSSI